MSSLASHFPHTFTGRLVTPADADYDIVRWVHNFVDSVPRSSRGAAAPRMSSMP